MQNVFIPRFLMKNVDRITTTKGDYDDSGDWVPGVETKTTIKAFYAPFGSKEIKDYPQGFIEIGDMDIRTKAELNKGDIIEINSEKWKIMDRINYSYIADLKFYVGRRSDKNG